MGQNRGYHRNWTVDTEHAQHSNAGMAGSTLHHYIRHEAEMGENKVNRLSQCFNMSQLYDPGRLIMMTFNITNKDKPNLVQGSCCQSLAPLSNAAAMLATWSRWSLTSAAGGLKFANHVL